jgi:hypothetical protein
MLTQLWTPFHLLESGKKESLKKDTRPSLKDGSGLMKTIKTLMLSWLPPLAKEP